MPAAPANDRYVPASIVLHWLMLALMIGAYAAIELRDFYPPGTDTRELLKAWHYTIGLSVFVLVWLRIAARLIWAAPAAVEGGWRHALSVATHGALYVLMIAMPLAGWVILSAEGDPIPFFGLELPALTGPNHALAEQVEGLHELGGTIGYWLIGLHATAALFHHYVLRDGLLTRMVPSRT